MLIGIDASRATVARRTGTEAYAYFLIRGLIEKTASSGHRLRLYFNAAPPSKLFPTFDHVQTRIIPFPRLWTHVRLARELAQNPPDVFFTPAHVIPFSFRGAAVATVHDLGFHFFPAAHTAGQVAYLKLSTRSNSRLSARLIADSEATSRDLANLYGVDPDIIRVVYPGLDRALSRVEDHNRLLKTWHRYQIRPPYLLYLGTLQPRKNLSNLVRAFAMAALPHMLVLGGKPGWQIEELQRTLQELPSSIREQIVLPGYVAEEDKAALLSGAEAFVFPSLYEGFGFPVLEAQVCGTPVLAANSSSLPEVTGGSALLIDPQDVDALAQGLRRIVSDKPYREQLRRAGYLNVSRFDWGRAAEATLAVLEEAAGIS
ncbi:MAG: glycosyltransferase family 4 protein [Candidatus Promineifilaceae bacterium]